MTKRRIFPTSVTLDSYVVPDGAARGSLRYVVSISDEHHSKELLYTFNFAEALRFARRSAGQRGLRVIDKTSQEHG